MKAKFRLEFAPRFERRLKALERQDQIRILREAQILAENPYELTEGDRELRDRIRTNRAERE